MSVSLYIAYLDCLKSAVCVIAESRSHAVFRAIECIKAYAAEERSCVDGLEGGSWDEKFSAFISQARNELEDKLVRAPGGAIVHVRV